MAESLVGQIVHAVCGDAGDFGNSFCLIVEDDEETVTLVPLRRFIIGKNSLGYDLEQPEVPADPAAAAPYWDLITGGTPQPARKSLDADASPVFQVRQFSYRLWDGLAAPCCQIM
jgi:hypothetical protein